MLLEAQGITQKDCSVSALFLTKILQPTWDTWYYSLEKATRLRT